MSRSGTNAGERSRQLLPAGDSVLLLAGEIMNAGGLSKRIVDLP